MQKFYKDFLFALDKEDKRQAVEMVIKKLDTITTKEELVSLYTEVLAKSLNEMTCNLKEKKLCIWKEHIRSSIIRTILECCYPYIVKLSDKDSKGSVAIICPDGEYHEIGARMAADFFMLNGYRAVYVGSSMPKEEFVDAINEIHPEVLAMSVTNYYNLVAAKKTVEAIRAKVNYPLFVAVGGNAFINNPNSYKEIGADAVINTYADISAIKLGGK